MTMTSVAVVQGSLGATPAMMNPKRYHLQQGPTPSSPSPTSGKNYDTISKGKKSWSVRLGLSRQNQSSEDPGKQGWGTISGGSALSRQMRYGDPWMYGTVRSQRGLPDPRNFLGPPQTAPVLIVCSCPEFLTGTTRKLGSCKRCGGHRLAGLPLGGTCRVPSTSTRLRPSLAGVLRSVDDPYDLMRRSRLVEPRSRARSISPHRQTAQRDGRSQSVVRAAKERKASTETDSRNASRSEWFDTEVVYEEPSRKPRPSFAGASNDDWLEEAPVDDVRVIPGRIVRSPKRAKNEEDWDDAASSTGADSRKSILECDVNPYMLVKKQLRDEDDLSDDLSDNALELDEARSTLFDPSKVKSIERTPNRSAVAAIGGQRVRVFSEPREISDGEESAPVTRIPLPKVSPKRPPRKQKEAKTAALRSILKRNRAEGKKKSVLFNVDNVIFAPEKAEVLSSRKSSRSSVASSRGDSELEEMAVDEEEEYQEKPKFITIPNIRDPRVVEKSKVQEMKVLAEVKTVEKIKIDKFVPSRKSHVVKRTPEKEAAAEKVEKTEVPVTPTPTPDSWCGVGGEVKFPEGKIEGTTEEPKKDTKDSKVIPKIRPEDETELEIEIEELSDRQPEIAVDEKDLILKSEATARKPSLRRSQSDRSAEKPELTAGNILFADTMRLSLCRRNREDKFASKSPKSFPENPKPKDDRQNTIFEAEEPEEPWESPPRIASVAEDAPEKSSDLSEKELEPPPDFENVMIRPTSEHFQKMRPTSWSPPPGKHKNQAQNRASDPGVTSKVRGPVSGDRDAVGNFGNAKESNGTSSKIEIGSGKSDNVCKITVSPLESPLVHRLQIGSDVPKGGRRTSILINGDQNSTSDSVGFNNRVTISVGGEDSVCNPTVISVNTEGCPKIQSTSENRTLVILDNYKSNIVVESPKEEKLKRLSFDDAEDSSTLSNGDSSPDSCPSSILGKPQENPEIVDKLSKQTTKQSPEVRLRSEVEKSPKIVDKWSSLSKEAVISKLLEDSLKKARENGEILDESSGEVILKILKQTLLKSKEYESSESTIEPYSRSLSMTSETDFVSTNLFIEENPYEIIKEPIYEEIPDEPPPLPLSPPPTEDYLKDRIYFGDDYKEEYYKKVNSGQFLRSYFPEDFFKKPSAEELSSEGYLKTTSTENFASKFELLNFLVDSKDRGDQVEEEDAEGEIEALYEQKETSLGDLSSKSSQISNVSDSSEECNIILTSSPETLKMRTVDIERTDSGVGSESSQASSSRGVARRWRGNASLGPGSRLGRVPQVPSGDAKLCEDCEQCLEPLVTDSGVVYAPFVCRKCSKKRAERKEIIMEIVETEQKYGRDLQIILEEFHRPMLQAGLLTQEQLSAIFLNVEELLEHNIMLAEKLRDVVEFAQESGDEDLVIVDVGKIFLESEGMLHAFESYCTRQGSASLLLQNLEKEKELLRIFLKVSQMENTVLRRMNLNSFLMVPVQRVTKYPLLLARLLKATPSVRHDVQEAKNRLKQAQTNIELHLEHMNAEAKDVTSTKLWRRISIIQNGRRSTGEQDMVNIKLRKMAVEVLEWAHEEARFVLEGRLLVAQPTDNNWRRGRTVKLAPVIAMLVTNGKPNTEFVDFTDDSLFPRQIGIKDATLLLVKEKIGRYSLLREPLYLDKCIVCCEADLEDYFEIQELSSKETFIFKAEDGVRTKRWCRTLQAHAQSLGAWRRRRGALPNIMICGVARN